MYHELCPSSFINNIHRCCSVVVVVDKLRRTLCCHGESGNPRNSAFAGNLNVTLPKFWPIQLIKERVL